MFGIGGGELIFIVFIILMLFGADKVPEIARTIGKTIAHIKNATNDLKSEIKKGAEINGLDTKSLETFTNPITSEINKIKEDIHGKNDVFPSTPADIFKIEKKSINEANSENVEFISGAIKREK